MKVLRFTSILILSFIVGHISAQQAMMNNILYNNKVLVNPAYTGDADHLVGYLDIRNQWSGMAGHPESRQFGLHGSLNDRMGLGGSFISDSRGITQLISGNLAYSYKVPFSLSSSLAFGINVGFNKWELDKTEMKVENPSDEVLTADNYDAMSFGAGFGVAFDWNDRLSIGLSSPQLLTKEHELQNNLLALASFKFYTVSDNLIIEPTVIYRSLPAVDGIFDMSLIAEWKKSFWGGFGYRTNSSMIVSGGVKIKNVSFGMAYAFENTSPFTKNDFQDESAIFVGQTFEVLLAYHFIPKDKSLIPEDDSITTSAIVNNESYIQAKKETVKESAELDDYTRRIEELQRELNELNKVVDPKTNETIDDGTLSYNPNRIESGNYVVIHTFRNWDNVANTVQKMRDNSIKGFVLYNKTKQSYYIYTDMYKNLDEAIQVMEKYRAKGFKAWVLLY